MIFCSATANDRYTEPFFLFSSIKRIYKNSQCYFDGINFSDRELKNVSDLGVNVRNFSIPNDLPDEFGPYKDLEKICRDNEAYTPESLISAAWKIFMLDDIMKTTNQPVGWFDTDCLFRRNIDELLKEHSKSDVTVTVRKTDKEHAKVLSSIVLVNNSKKGKYFLEKLKGEYSKCWEHSGWWADQLSVYRAVKSSKVIVNNLNIHKYNNSKLSDSASIWHCKHEGKKRKKWINGCVNAGGIYPND